MAHSAEIKAQALALLMTGSSIAEVRKATGVPDRTLRRWRPQAYRIAREALQSIPEGRQLLDDLRRLRPQLAQLAGSRRSGGSRQNGRKKRLSSTALIDIKG